MSADFTKSERKIFIAGKKAGSRSLARLVKSMRDQQKLYFQTKDHGRLKKAKELESQVDRAVEAVLK